ncbi:MAG: bifunctional GTP diphosphokinase/guanosine-3',5'-bis pyrophosphate 3'-pyrophosphohydrolase [Gammaproteobacteria bacterium]|nr:bifunctional GTP diphosphokinase/guanosine-3',5'-bis pyrophosphate 3'-pyrophosphohydrolase [Gammaproteobacteria bacterium]MBU2179123.1 bifunctional GTP diphosphokinase/guanosine-3',5'-bis pyrophosphate 3'-pyrophosphohydrolase [Gammaproteobacteria bacterium]MBU2279735.1 bifunctional GTP diphosphokinase/guanosine-3',5'-bis pyrophosphate 3'-pyrophosphohydrolase [Gammaproteobacteria bacterium]MBU2427102.1 bifunctional GTP diphosphokinase/guanosine-3',5'-bis pyrophosphate 3'-pyrophosphohydrolase [
MYLFEGLKQQISAYLPAEQVAMVQQAYLLARDAHAPQTRSSGEPYITHPVAVASILAEMRMDHETLMAALLHDVIEDTEYSKEDLEQRFGSTVAELVQGVSKLDKVKFKDIKEFEVTNLQKMFMAMTQDIRVILIKLADRTHNMRTIGALKPEKRRRIAKETLELYAPIANRLGIHNIKNELEDWGFRALYPMRYRALETAVKQARGNRREVIEKIQSEIEARIGHAGITAEVSGREKHLYSIYRKMKSKELMFNDVMDIYGFRVLVDSVDSCYRILGVVHNLYKPIEIRFKDYIAIPKQNGYQSLHTSLIGPHGIPVEIQMRTREMDEMADNGIAAHWKYKKPGEQGDSTAQIRARRWMQSLLEIQQSAGNTYEFVENVKSELYPDELYVFTPKGKIVELPIGATAVDFAYAVHTDIGNKCVGARVDRKPYPLSKPLETGQTVEVITSTGGKPNANWLNYVVTSRAIMGIRNFLKKQEQSEAIALGKRLLTSALGEVPFESIAPDRVEQVLQNSKQKTLDELFIDIGLGNQLPIAVARRMLGEFDENSNTDEALPAKPKAFIIGSEGMLTTFAKCCRPIPGDVIAASASPGKGLNIHRTECRNIRGWEKEPGKFFPVRWDKTGDKQFFCDIRVFIVNKQGMLAKLTTVIAGLDSNIQDLATDDRDTGDYVIKITLSVRDRIHLANVMRKIRVTPDVLKVYRRK